MIPISVFCGQGLTELCEQDGKQGEPQSLAKANDEALASQTAEK